MRFCTFCHRTGVVFGILGGMDNDISSRLDILEAKLDATYRSAEKMRKYFLVTMWVTIVTIVLPMIGLALVIPSFINIYTNTLGGF